MMRGKAILNSKQRLRSANSSFYETISSQASTPPSLRGSQYRCLSGVQDGISSTLDEGMSKNSFHDNDLETSELTTLSREELLKSFVHKIKGNVERILIFLDEEKRKSDSSEEAGKWRQKLLSTKWKNWLRRERLWHGKKSNLRSESSLKVGVETSWHEALYAARLPFEDPLSLLSQQSPTREMDFSRYDGEVDWGEDSHSPIFGLEINDKGYLQELDSEASVDSFFDSFKENDYEESKTLLMQDLDDVGSKSKEFHNLQEDAILRVLALLRATTAREWKHFDSYFKGTFEVDKLAAEEFYLKSRDLLHHEWSGNLGETSDNGSEPSETSMNSMHHLRTESKSKKYVLTTTESNLLLARIVTSLDMPVDQILREALQLYHGMTVLEQSGRKESGPDADTYRILIMALNRRLLAPGEAIKLCQNMMESPEILSPQLFLDGMDTCFAHRDLKIASRMMDLIHDPVVQFKPPLRAYILLLKMIKKQNLQGDALRLLQYYEQVRQTSPH